MSKQEEKKAKNANYPPFPLVKTWVNNLMDSESDMVKERAKEMLLGAFGDMKNVATFLDANGGLNAEPEPTGQLTALARQSIEKQSELKAQTSSYEIENPDTYEAKPKTQKVQPKIILKSKRKFSYSKT